jgi:hypothetical protein
MPDITSETESESESESESETETVTESEADDTSTKDRYIRLILNDAVVPLTGIRGCPEHEEGLCPLDGFVKSLKEIVAGVNFVKDCGGVVQAQV